MIADAAARAVGCDHAVVLIRSHEHWNLIATGGRAASMAVTTAPRCERLTLLDPVDGGVPVCSVDAGMLPALGCPFDLGGRNVGLLLVAASVGSILNTAQICVLRAHAAQLSTLLHQDAIARPRIAPLVREQIEGLRWLESATVHARNSIITEAEPIDLPCPRILYCKAAFTKATG